MKPWLKIVSLSLTAALLALVGIQARAQTWKLRLHSQQKSNALRPLC